MFSFKGISTKEMRIIVEEPDNLIAKAPIKHEILNIEGRDDAIYYPLGRSPIEISLTLQLLDPSKVDQVLMWLDGEGELIYKDRKTKARIFSEVQPIRTSGIRLINIDVVRSPYWVIIEDEYSKPWGINLILGGWDSFEPYGSGTNYVENWNFENDVNRWSGFRMASKIVDNTLRCEITSTNTPKQVSSTVSIPHKNALLRLKMKGNCTVTIYNWGNVSDLGINSIKLNNDWNIFEFPFNVVDIKEAIVIRIFADKTDIGDWFEIDWIQITPISNQHLIVEKTTKPNGLMHVQTWGGNDIRKLRVSDLPRDRNKIMSFFVKDNVFFSLYDYFSSGTRRSYEPNYNEVAFNKIGFSAPNNFIEARRATDNLDFIASNPVIVEGEKPPTWEADEHPRIVNEGNAVAKPLIRLTKGTSNTCEFEVNGLYFKYHFNQDDEVVIDCEKMEASDKGQLRNRHLTIGYEFPKLDPGPNVVKTISGDAIIEFKRKDRWL